MSPVASYDKAMIRVGINPATGGYINHNDPEALPKLISEDVYRRIVTSTPQLKWTLEGEKMVHNDTKTVRDAFSIIPGDKEIELLQTSNAEPLSKPIQTQLDQLYANGTKTLDQEVAQSLKNPISNEYYTGTKPYFSQTMTNIDEAIIVFTRVVVDMHRATGAKEKLSRKSYANGFARCLLILCPEINDKIKRIASDTNDNPDDDIIF